MDAGSGGEGKSAGSAFPSATFDLRALGSVRAAYESPTEVRIFFGDGLRQTEVIFAREQAVALLVVPRYGISPVETAFQILRREFEVAAAAQAGFVRKLREERSQRKEGADAGTDSS